MLQLIKISKTKFIKRWHS